MTCIAVAQGTLLPISFNKTSLDTNRVLLIANAIFFVASPPTENWHPAQNRAILAQRLHKMGALRAQFCCFVSAFLPLELPLGELWTLTCFAQAHLLTFHLSSVTRQESSRTHWAA